jgi:transposase
MGYSSPAIRTVCTTGYDATRREVLRLCASAVGGGASRPTFPKSVAQAEHELTEVLHTSPRQYGIARVRWRLQDLPQALSWPGHYSERQLRFSRKQAMRWVHSPDPEYHRKRQALVAAFWHAITAPDSCVLVFLDEVTYYRRPSLAPCYHPRGATLPHVPDNTRYNTQTRIVAALNGWDGQVTYWQRSEVGQQQLVGFYRHLRQVYPSPTTLYVVQDNWPVHKLPAVQAVMQTERLTPVFLPTYASWLNPIEKLWRWLRQDVLHTHSLAADLDQLRTQVCSFLDQFATGSDALLRYTGLLPI